MIYDMIVIGAGASGMTAAACADWEEDLCNRKRKV